MVPICTGKGNIKRVQKMDHIFWKSKEIKVFVGNLIGKKFGNKSGFYF